MIDKILKKLSLKNCKKGSRYILGGLVTLWLTLVLLAPLIEFAKIVTFIFVRSDDVIKLNNAVELTYFLIASFVPCKSLCSLDRAIADMHRILSITQLSHFIGWIIATNCIACCIQTGLTPNILKQKLLDDIGDIPSNCPSDYPYPVPKLYLACMIRATNFVFMWMYTCLNIIFLLMAFSGILPTEDELVRKKKDFNIKTIIEGIEDDEEKK
ncbi:5417_t:CDS:2 [Funneliformis caledonium]|uniref:5417_t:CDS:1 n=1 Tax=Funneliformis caledonium TaxID=1117310 RepID=A0A9N9C1W4_9GLOM|nr:5417_t:CDS:2 [Funneliformis caledonium]